MREQTGAGERDGQNWGATCGGAKKKAALVFSRQTDTLEHAPTPSIIASSWLSVCSCSSSPPAAPPAPRLPPRASNSSMKSCAFSVSAHDFVTEENCALPEVLDLINSTYAQVHNLRTGPFTRADQILEWFDEDGDGRVSASEFAEKMKQEKDAKKAARRGEPPELLGDGGIALGRALSRALSIVARNATHQLRSPHTLTPPPCPARGRGASRASGPPPAAAWPQAAQSAAPFHHVFCS